MKQWLTKIQRVITNKKNRPGIYVIIVLVLFLFAGRFENYYVKKNGVFIVATIVDTETAPRGYVAYIKYSYKHRTYEETVSFGFHVANKENIGRKLIFAILPNHPTIMSYIDFAPDCLDDSPPEGWTEIPKCE